MTFLEAVNRVLRQTGIIKGDDDNIVAFTDIQHNATLNLAQIAIQSELNSLVADSLVPYERDTQQIVTVASTRTYNLYPTFVRFWGTPTLYDATGNRSLFNVDEHYLRRQIENYKAIYGAPMYWYFVHGTTKKIGFYPVPTAVTTWDYEFEKGVGVVSSGDVLPFQSDQEAQVFCNLAARHFLYLFEERPEQTLANLAEDRLYKSEKATLVNLMSGANPPAFYGVRYA